MRTSVLLVLTLSVCIAQPPQSNDPTADPMFKGMRYRSIGPYRGGRSLTVAGIPGDPYTYYFGGVGGGVWKSTDGALTWSPVFDKEATSAIGSLAIAPSDSNILYVGTGEAALRGNISHGDGIYKSVDAGKTWKNVGLKDSRAIGKVIIHPRNPDVVYVAALGHPYGPNPERGVFRTMNGGRTWEKVLYKDENSGAVDIAFDPNNPNIIFAALWQVRRTPWGFDSGGPGSGLYKSTDAGTTWKQLQGSGLPKGPLGKIGIAVAPNSDRVYALIQAAEGGLYRSDDGGQKWQLINPDRALIQRAWYYMHIFSDPKDADDLYILNVQFFKSTDGGHTFNKIRPPHGDNHALWIDPQNTQRMISGDDGGATVTVNSGKTWTPQLNQPTAQFYHVITDNRFPYHVYGAQQDNTTIAITSRSDSGSIDRPDWYPVGGGESGYIAPYPPDPDIVYAGGYEGSLTRFDKHTGQRQQVSPWPEITDGEGAANLKHRFQWTAPTLISPHDPNVLYHAGEVLFKTTDAGVHWDAISPDLTRNDKSKQVAPGGSIDKDDTGTEYYDTIYSVIESPTIKGLIWVGTDDGLVQLTRNGGKNWENVTPKDMPEWSRIDLIDASPHEPGAAYVVADRHELDDYHPYIYKTNDYGKTWTKIVSGIPDGDFARAVREDPKRRGLLFAGTETGVFVSFDDGAAWRPLRLNLPTTPIHDLVVKENDLVLATHGRAFWILDDISPLRQHKAEIANETAYLYQPAAAYRVHGGGRGGGGGRATTAGENPPTGAIIYYYLKAAPKGEVTIEILDAAGKHIRTVSSTKTQFLTEPPDPDSEKPRKELDAQAGLNRFVWDMRFDAAPRIAGYYLYDYESGTHGPLVVPGKYQVKLTVEGKSYTAPLELKPDPRIKTTPEDFEKQLTLQQRIHRDLSNVYESVIQMRDVRTQLKDLRERLPESEPAKRIATAADDLDKKIATVQDEFVDFRITSNEDSLAYPLGLDGKLAGLAMAVESTSDTAPTQSELELFQVLSRKLDEDLTKWGSIKAKDIPAFQRMTDDQHLHTIVLK
ncbi:MAG TPA: hypothetical protein VKV15_02860 [Bryobacteraceae bacterium]|nr:hypothetical protein [Bryobacteraceae bacterium]